MLIIRKYIKLSEDYSGLIETIPLQVDYDESYDYSDSYSTLFYNSKTYNLIDNSELSGVLKESKVIDLYYENR